jgi:glycosyltransferase involved in cell wall biosynthesis
MTAAPLVTVVTPTTGDRRVLRAVESVAAQSHGNIQHLVVIDNPGAPAEIKAAIRQHKVDVIELPYATGQDRFQGHRIYGASAFLGKGDYFCFLDEDNWFDADHVASLVEVVKRGFAWAFSFRKIMDREGNFICNDDCESLGKWPSILGDHDYLVDTSCYLLPRTIAVQSSPIWFRRTREPFSPDPDRALVGLLRQHKLSYEASMRYTVNYRVGNTELSVCKEFFVQGNRRMLQKYQGNLPWKARNVAAPPPVSARNDKSQMKT